MININTAIDLANEYKKNGKLNTLDLSDLLKFILWNNDEISNNIVNLAFVNEKTYQGYYKSILLKFEVNGYIHPSEVNVFVMYFKWSMNNDAIDLRKFANLIDIIANEELERDLDIDTIYPSAWYIHEYIKEDEDKNDEYEGFVNDNQYIKVLNN